MAKGIHTDGGWLPLLEAITGGRFRQAPLQLNQLALGAGLEGTQPHHRQVRVASTALPTEPFEQAWLLAESFAGGIDRQFGRHCTPRPLAEQLARDCLATADALAIVDPAVGGGSLLLAYAEVQRQITGRNDFDLLVGCDLDPLAVAASEAVLWVAAGQPAFPVGRFAVRDFFHQGLPLDLPGRDALLLANPPWGLKPNRQALEAWRKRVKGGVLALLEGEVNSYAFFLLEALLTTGWSCGFVTPFDWLYQRRAAKMRRALASTRRLTRLFVLRKRVFAAAPDMIPVLSVWSDAPHDGRIRLRRSGLHASIPLPRPIPVESEIELSASEWERMPFAILPLLRSRQFYPFNRDFLQAAERLGDPEQPVAERLFHIGDGAYKSRVMPFVSRSTGPMPILTRAAEAGRYRLDPPRTYLAASGVALLSERERCRFRTSKLLLHALKKASAPWRLAGTIHQASDGPLALTNNFVLLHPLRYDGDLHYPLALLNTRLFNRMYTETFPGVNIEAFSLGCLPLPWPPAEGGHPPPGDAADLPEWYTWPQKQPRPPGTLPRPVYLWLCQQARALQASNGQNRLADLRVEAVVAGLFDLPFPLLLLLTQPENGV
ncbi:MAG: N-6 DNA methylase [Bradymonadales bacterium]|nr:N-6 DNA methylase [Bradymonadales bacterium]